jgi:hypothetical protein
MTAEEEAWYQELQKGYRRAGYSLRKSKKKSAAIRGQELELYNANGDFIEAGRLNRMAHILHDLYAVL